MKRLIFSIFAASLVAFTGCNNGKTSSSGSESTATDSIESLDVVAQVDTFSYKGYQMLAEILAGKTPADATFLSNVTGTKAFTAHSAEMNTRWNAYKAGYLDKIRTWIKESLPEGCDTVFYPFSGPDFNYLATFFPDTRYSVLIGIEPAGKLPLTTAEEQAKSAELLSAARQSIRTNMSSSFFKTDDMKEDLDCEVQGTLPIALMFMAMHGYEVITVNPIELTEDGNLVYSDPKNVFAHTLDKNIDKGYEIMYRLPGEKGARTLSYLSTDISNYGPEIDRVTKLVDNKFNGQTTFLKAASYLLHKPHFSKMRNAILENTNTILSGPSGLPYSAFDKSVWDVTLYGTWASPIKIFAHYPQEDMKKAYEEAPKRPINFRYDYGSGTSVYVASKKAK